MIEEGFSPAQSVLAPPIVLPGSDRLQQVVSAGQQYVQPLCGNKEGWGPISDHRYDFTPCFLDVWVVVASAFGIVCGTAAIWYLLRKGTPQPVKQNWHFFAKLVCEW